MKLCDLRVILWEQVSNMYLFHDKISECSNIKLFSIVWAQKLIIDKLGMIAVWNGSTDIQGRSQNLRHF